jgi:hypothetical protein
MSTASRVILQCRRSDRVRFPRNAAPLALLFELAGEGPTMMKREKFEIANIYVPVKRRSTLKPELVQQIAQSMLESGQETPILARLRPAPSRRHAWSKVEVAPIALKAGRGGRDGGDRNKRRLRPVLNPARWALKGPADFGFEPRKALIGKAGAFDVTVYFGLPLNPLRNPDCSGPNLIGEGHDGLPE